MVNINISESAQVYLLQLLEKQEVEEALKSPEHLAITKGVVARLVILLSNVQPQQEGK